MKFLPQAEDVPAAREKSRYRAGRGPVQSVRNFFRQNVQPADFLFIFASKTFLKRSMFSNRTAQNWWVALIGFK